MKVWTKIEPINKHYIVTFSSLVFFWVLFFVLGFEFIDIIFFIMAFIWHFALTIPGLKEKVLISYHRLSFLSVIVRLNHYLQMFINIKGVKYQSSLVRLLSPLIFAILVSVIVGQASLLFTLIGSVVFECIYIFITKKLIGEKTILSNDINDPSIPPVIPNEENSHE